MVKSGLMVEWSVCAVRTPRDKGTPRDFISFHYPCFIRRVSGSALEWGSFVVVESWGVPSKFSDIIFDFFLHFLIFQPHSDQMARCVAEMDWTSHHFRHSVHGISRYAGRRVAVIGLGVFDRRVGPEWARDSYAGCHVHGCTPNRHLSHNNRHHSMGRSTHGRFLFGKCCKYKLEFFVGDGSK